jgi:hypothetical protein
MQLGDATRVAPFAAPQRHRGGGLTAQRDLVAWQMTASGQRL